MRTEYSRKRIRMLLIMLAIMAIFMVVTTYAWFSTQKDVSISGLNVKVEVAESMQISLNGDEWFQDITITDMKQLLGTATGDVHQANATNTNYIPTILEPVSTVGTLNSGILAFKKGILNVNKLENINSCSETTLTTETNGDHPYLVFDLYVRNVSASATNDNLQLNKGSTVSAEQSGVGLQQSTRVGFVAYNTNTKDLTASGSDIRSIAGGEDDKVAIWEPNHTKYFTGTIIDKEAEVTYCLADSIAANGTVEDVYAGQTTQLLPVLTNQVDQAETDATVVVANLQTVDNSGTLSIAPNKITKVRVYLWLEGQDTDCVHIASTGKSVSAIIKLTKGKEAQTHLHEDFAS